jgi:predicted DNA-binding protein (UPF0251 family)
MPRPIKWRNVCGMPGVTKFGPLGVQNHSNGIIQMTVDEYETIRLIDHVGYNQEQCAKQMNVARTTVQGIYNVARKKIAASIVEGKTLLISGGEYQLCDDFGTECNGRGCHGRGRGREF